jgi:hypothetical protein
MMTIDAAAKLAQLDPLTLVPYKITAEAGQNDQGIHLYGIFIFASFKNQDLEAR